MLTVDELITKLTVGLTKGYIDKLSVTIRQQGFDLNKLIDLTFHPDDQIAFRAVWLLDYTILASPEIYADNLPHLVNCMARVTNGSSKRHYARIMMMLTSPAAPQVVRQKLQNLNLENVVEQCFDWLIDPRVKVAVKVFAADTLFNLSPRYDWIADELANQVIFLMRNGGPAIQSRGKKLLAALNPKK